MRYSIGKVNNILNIESTKQANEVDLFKLIFEERKVTVKGVTFKPDINLIRNANGFSWGCANFNFASGSLRGEFQNSSDDLDLEKEMYIFLNEVLNIECKITLAIMRAFN